MTLREKLNEILEPRFDSNSRLSKIYDSFMMLMIIISIAPLAFRRPSYVLYIFDRVSVIFFIIDYFLRWFTADIKSRHKRKLVSFLIYPFTPMAIIDLLSILPSIGYLSRTLKILRMVRLLKLTRILRFVRYSKRILSLLYVLKKERVILLTVLAIVVFYIFTTALIMYNVEMYNEGPGGEIVFDTFFHALYWSTTTLTTIGYGDIYPVSDVGRLISMISSIFGVAVVALPTGVITASYLDELKRHRKEKEDKE